MKKIILIISILILLGLIYQQVQNQPAQIEVESTNLYKGPNPQSYIIE